MSDPLTEDICKIADELPERYSLAFFADYRRFVHTVHSFEELALHCRRVALMFADDVPVVARAWSRAAKAVAATTVEWPDYVPDWPDDAADEA